MNANETMYELGTRVQGDNLHGIIEGYATVFKNNIPTMMYVIRLTRGEYLCPNIFVSSLVVHPDNIWSELPDTGRDY